MKLQFIVIKIYFKKNYDKLRNYPYVFLRYCLIIVKYS